MRSDHGELQLVVELVGQVLRVDHGLVGPDDRVDVLEEDDPGCDLVRPADLLRLLLVLAKVSGGVEELLRDDRCAQTGLGQRDALTRLVRAATLEVLAHRRHVENRDLLAVEKPDATLPVADRDELHASTSQTCIATRAYTSAVLTSPSISRFSPRSTSISPVEVP